MASNHVLVNASPQAVWKVLADPDSYADWVVGSSETRSVEGHWPDPGATFHHAQGLGPLSIRDTTEVIDSREPERLVLEARMRPLLIGRVELALERHGEGTWLTISESAFGGLGGRLAGPLLDPLLGFRNIESLRRLRRLAEQQGRMTDTRNG